MENEYKQFAPFDRVLVRDSQDKWQIDFYSHWDEVNKQHITLAYGDGLRIEDKDILLFEGNEHLLGKSDEPEEEVKLEVGEWIACSDKIERMKNGQCNMEIFGDIREGGFETKELDWIYTFCIRFSDYNPNDMDETRKHILCVKDGRIVQYKE